MLLKGKCIIISSRDNLKVEIQTTICINYLTWQDLSLAWIRFSSCIIFLKRFYLERFPNNFVNNPLKTLRLFLYFNANFKFSVLLSLLYIKKCLVINKKRKYMGYRFSYFFSFQLFVSISSNLTSILE